jgi:hypothetical protein
MWHWKPWGARRLRYACVQFLVEATVLRCDIEVRDAHVGLFGLLQCAYAVNSTSCRPGPPRQKVPVTMDCHDRRSDVGSLRHEHLTGCRAP